MEKMDIAHDTKVKGRPKMIWMEVIKNYMKLLELEERVMVDRNDWRRRIHVLDRNKLFYVLVLIADPKLIGIKACWFGLVYTLVFRKYL